MIRFVPPDLRRVEGTATTGLALYRFEELAPFQGVGSLLDWRLRGHLSRVTIDGFFTGAGNETLLMPLGRFLPHQFLVLLGLGPRADFSKAAFQAALSHTFDVARGLGVSDLTLSLPGRVESLCEEMAAIEWFLEQYDLAADMGDMVLIEPADIQKRMLPAVERWRLRGLVPEA